MSTYNYLKKYKHENYIEYMDDDRNFNKLHVFQNEAIEEINKNLEKLSTTLNISIPLELKNFYNEIGYGYFFHGVKNRFGTPNILSLEEILDTYIINEEDENKEENWDSDCGIKKEEYIEELKNEGRLLFCEPDYNYGLTVGINEVNDNGECPVYYYDEKIAHNLKEFIKKIYIDLDYYLETEDREKTNKIYENPDKYFKLRIECPEDFHKEESVSIKKKYQYLDIIEKIQDNIFNKSYSRQINNILFIPIIKNENSIGYDGSEELEIHLENKFAYIVLKYDYSKFISQSVEKQIKITKELLIKGIDMLIDNGIEFDKEKFKKDLYM